jgi:two-component system, NarL family, sensor kinase
MDTNETKIYISVLIGVSVLLVLVAFFIVTITRYQRRKVAFHLDNLKAGFDLLDEERKRIACDLHDDLGSTLSFVKMQLKWISGLDGRNAELVEISGIHLVKAIQKIKRISFNMIPRVLEDWGLDAALKELVEMITDSMQIKIDYHCGINTIGEHYDLHIYRIAQEILNNIAKHSKATFVTFTILKTDHKIHMRIKDNGIGFHKTMLNKHTTGLGFHNISARTELLKGSLYLEAQPGKGVDYLIEIPL